MELDETQVWDQQDDETAAAFELFAIYREMHPVLRSVKAVMEHDPSKRGLTAIKQLSARHQWKLRAKAYDAHADALRQAQGQQVRKEMADTYLNQARALDAKNIEAIEELDPKKVGPQYLPRLMDAAMKAHRIGVGDEPIVKETNVGFEAQIEKLNKEMSKP